MMLNTEKNNLEIHFTFLCRTTRKLQNNESPIVFRTIYRGQRKDVFTGLSCPAIFWLKEEKMVSHKYKPASTINKQLQSILFNATEAFQKLKFSREEFSLDELLNAIQGKTQPPQTIAEYIILKEADIEKE
jgi:hypothetical protein